MFLIKLIYVRTYRHWLSLGLLSMIKQYFANIKHAYKQLFFYPAANDSTVNKIYFVLMKDHAQKRQEGC